MIHQVGGRSPWELDLGSRQVVVLEAQRAHGDLTVTMRCVYVKEVTLPHSMRRGVRLRLV